MFNYKCPCCNLVRNSEIDGLPFEADLPGKGRRKVCPHCWQTKPYSTENNVLQGAMNTVDLHGLELEVHAYGQSKAIMCDAQYGLIPTEDCSIREWDGVGEQYEAVEFISSIRANSSGLRQSLRTWIKSGADFTTEDTGQHIHFSRSDWPREKYEAVKAYADEIFLPLEKYLIEHPKEVEQVFGRPFNRAYAAPSHGRWFSTRYVWLNLNLCNQFELRIAKFRTIDQYKALVDFTKELMAKINTWFFGHNHDPEQTGEQLVKLFRKYAAGKAATFKQSKFKD